MLQTLDEVRKAEMSVGTVMNGVDNANLMSVDSTSPIETRADILESDEKEGEVPDASKTEKKPTEKAEALPVKKEEKKEKEEKPPETKDAVAKRIGDLTKRWRTAERERDFERARIEKLEEELAKLKSTTSLTAKPKKEDFEDEDSYHEALMDWKVEEKLRVAKEESAKKVEKESEKTATDEVFQNLDEVMEKGREKYEDFNELVLNEDLVLPPEITEIILQGDSAVAAEVFYYLGQNPDESAIIAKMSLSRAAREIGKIEVKVSSEKKEEEEEEEEEEETPPAKPPAKPAPPVKKTSKAPEPITPLKADGVVDKDPSQMTPKEYRAWRESRKG